MHSVTNVTGPSSCFLELRSHIRCLHTCGACEILGARPLLREPLLASEQSNGTAVWAVWQSVSCSPLHFFLDPTLGDREELLWGDKLYPPQCEPFRTMITRCIAVMFLEADNGRSVKMDFNRRMVTLLRSLVSFPFVQVDTFDADYYPPDTRSSSPVHIDVKVRGSDARSGQTSPWKTQTLKPFVTSLSLALIRRVLCKITMS